MRIQNNIPIDAERLRREFEKRHLSFEGVSREFGRAKTYINQCLHDGRINKPTRAMLEKIYDIRYDEYCPLPESAMTLVDEKSNDSESTTPPPAPPFELDYARLYNIMYDAMYNAVKKAWSE